MEAGYWERIRDMAGNFPEEPLPSSQENRLRAEHFVVQIDAKTGAITRLRNKATGREWASAQNPVQLLTYQTLSAG